VVVFGRSEFYQGSNSEKDMDNTDQGIGVATFLPLFYKELSLKFSFKTIIDFLRSLLSMMSSGI
jgi:hypothetical protein